MYVCICANVTERQVRQAAREGATSLGDLTRVLGVGAGCGRCYEMAQQVLDTSTPRLPCPAMSRVATPA